MDDVDLKVMHFMSQLNYNNQQQSFDKKMDPTLPEPVQLKRASESKHHSLHAYHVETCSTTDAVIRWQNSFQRSRFGCLLYSAIHV